MEYKKLNLGNGTKLDETHFAHIEEGIFKAQEKADENARKIELVNELPEVTEADNGKFMQVVNGAWGAVAVINGNEVEY